MFPIKNRTMPTMLKRENGDEAQRLERHYCSSSVEIAHGIFGTLVQSAVASGRVLPVTIFYRHFSEMKADISEFTNASSPCCHSRSHISHMEFGHDRRLI